ncbi:MAG: methionine--tRNA ligase subunit beta, partial [Clostridia bacterium]|nr:methionine--tRNA ligase subunit beta [Clostridia bacterium]
KYIDETTPWVLAKDEATLPRLNAVLYNLLECIRILGIMLTPVIPSSSKSIAAQLGTDCAELEFGKVKEFTVGEATPLFARIDMPKVLEEIAAEQAKKAAEAEKAANVVKLPEISIDDFAKVELTTAKIIACEPIPKAKKLLKLTLDDGSGKPRTVASGIAKWYTPDDLIDHTVIVVSNLKPAVLCGVESNGMILAADCPDGDVKVIFADDIPAGCKIR